MLDQHKVVIGLFSIILICSGKLLKDYLYQNQLIEGMTVQRISPGIIQRPLAGDSNGTADLSFNITLDTTITGALTITATDASLNAARIVLPAASANYVITVLNKNRADKIATFTTTVSSSNSNNVITITPTSYSGDSGANQISAGTVINVGIKSITVYKSLPGDVANDVKFTITAPGNTESSMTITVSPKVIGVASSSSSTVDVEKALAAITTSIRATAQGSAEHTNLENAKNALIQILTNTYGSITGASQVLEDSGLYAAQKTAIDFISKEKERTTSNANMLETDNNNKKRMSQINMYYTQHYQANTDIMKNIIYISIGLIILTVLKMKDYIPSSIATLGTIFILVIGSIIIGKKIFDILRRSDMEFDKYDWSFDQSKLDKAVLTQTSTNPADLTELGVRQSMSAPCYGPACCDTDTVWDATNKKCKVPAPAPAPAPA
jgi:hypothetical protein